MSNIDFEKDQQEVIQKTGNLQTLAGEQFLAYQKNLNGDNFNIVESKRIFLRFSSDIKELYK